MKAKLGIAPIAWSNDDLPELGGETSLETCLSEARKAGYIGIETGGKFPKEPRALKLVLNNHDISLCGGWYSGTLLDNDLEIEKQKVREQLDLFIHLQAPCLVYGETSGTIQNVRNAPLSSRRVLNEEEFKPYGEKLTLFAEWCDHEGMPISFHHHMGTAIETERDLDLLMRNSDKAVSLLYDPGHMAFANGNVYEIIERYGHRISHFHAKDVRNKVVSELKRDKESFLDAVLKGAFTVPGDGSLDFDKLVQQLVNIKYEGWFVVEAEQDPKLAPPFEFACKGYASLSKSLSKAGYKIVE
ncbi:MAG: myo-inosose-2 dehydratase [Pseudomonadota bacterium]|nr:myo-inosose-2 dehydratase [Pseudomonadota bacterium]